MTDIIIGTTPTIIYNFQTVDVADVTVAFFTIKSNGAVMICKTLAEATVGEDALSWTLSQQETLMFCVNQRAHMMINWKLADGTRGASDKTELCFRSNDITEVI